MIRAETTIPAISATTLAGIVGGTALLGWSSVMVPTGVAIRARTTDALGIRE